MKPWSAHSFLREIVSSDIYTSLQPNTSGLLWCRFFVYLLLLLFFVFFSPFSVYLLWLSYTSAKAFEEDSSFSLFHNWPPGGVFPKRKWMNSIFIGLTTYILIRYIHSDTLVPCPVYPCGLSTLKWRDVDGNVQIGCQTGDVGGSQLSGLQWNMIEFDFSV